MDSVLGTNSGTESLCLGLANQRCRFKKLQIWFRLAGLSGQPRLEIVSDIKKWFQNPVSRPRARRRRIRKAEQPQLVVSIYERPATPHPGARRGYETTSTTLRQIIGALQIRVCRNIMVQWSTGRSAVGRAIHSGRSYENNSACSGVRGPSHGCSRRRGG